jgi:hypothetical protein
LAQKRVKESADEPAIMGDNSSLAAQLKVAEQEKESDVEGMERRAQIAIRYHTD